MKKKYIILLAILSACLFGCSSNNGELTDSLQTQNVTTPAPVITETEGQEAERVETSDETEDETEVMNINVSSQSLTSEGKWLTVINSTKANPAGPNLSPQLSWDEVEGADSYAIYMVDNSAGYWLHWRAMNVKGNELDLGAVLEDSSYEGPYPPSGTHEYEVIVYALKATPENYPGTFDSNASHIKVIEMNLDTIDGATGNILAKGSVTGTVIVGEAVE